MDPYAVLGVRPGASREEAQAAYRAAAKRWHPDLAGSVEAQARMALVNAAWELLRDGPPPQARQQAQPGRRGEGGMGSVWLSEPVRRALGRELLAALEADEDVPFVAPTATWASPQAVLAVTDRRLLWLLDDAVSHRVRSLRFGDVAAIEHRVRRPLRRVAELRVRTREGRRLAFSELRPATAAAITRHVLTAAPVSAPRR